MITENDLYERIKTLEYEKIESQDKIDKAMQYIEENCSADNKLALKIILKGEK